MPPRAPTKYSAHAAVALVLLAAGIGRARADAPDETERLEKYNPPAYPPGWPVDARPVALQAYPPGWPGNAQTTQEQANGGKPTAAYFAEPLLDRVGAASAAAQAFRSNIPLLVLKVAPPPTPPTPACSGDDCPPPPPPAPPSTFRDAIPDEPKVAAALWASDCGIARGKPSAWANATKPLTCAFMDDPSYDGWAGIEVRGRSSRRFDKKQFSIELWKQVPAAASASAEEVANIAAHGAIDLSFEPEVTRAQQLIHFNETKGRFAGMPKGEDYVLNGPFIDRSLLRNSLAYRLGQAMSDAEGGYWVPRAEPVELFWLASPATPNGAAVAEQLSPETDEYGGVHVMIEAIRVGKNRVNVRKFNASQYTRALPPNGPSYLFELAVEGLERWSACEGDSTNHVQCTLASRGGPVDHAATLPNWFHLYNHGGATAKPHQNRIDLSMYGTEASALLAANRYNRRGNGTTTSLRTMSARDAVANGLVERASDVRRDASSASRNVGGSLRAALRHPQIEVEDEFGTNDAVLGWLRAHLAAFESTLFTECAMPTPQGCPRAYTNAAAARASSYKRFVDIITWVDWFLLQELTGNVDGYTSSIYMHKREGDPRLRMGPAWDFNLAFGLSTVDASGKPDGGRRGSPDGALLVDYLLSRCPPIPAAGGGGTNACTASQQRVSRWYGRLLEDPSFRSAVQRRWQYLRRNALTDAAVLGALSALENELQDPAQRDMRRWPAAVRTSQAVFGGDGLIADPPDSRESSDAGGAWKAEVMRVRRWLLARLRFLDGAVSQGRLPRTDAMAAAAPSALPPLLPGGGGPSGGLPGLPGLF